MSEIATPENPPAWADLVPSQDLTEQRIKEARAAGLGRMLDYPVLSDAEYQGIELLRTMPVLKVLNEEAKAIAKAEAFERQRHGEHHRRQEELKRQHEKAVTDARLRGAPIPPKFVWEEIPGTGPNHDPSLLWKRLKLGVLAAQLLIVHQAADELIATLLKDPKLVDAEKRRARAQEALNEAEADAKPYESAMRYLEGLERSRLASAVRGGTFPTVQEDREVFAIDDEGRRVQTDRPSTRMRPRAR